jgi:hypothetical protein
LQNLDRPLFALLRGSSALGGVPDESILGFGFGFVARFG